MSESESGKSESPESSGGWSRWCFVIDTAGRIVHTAETAPAAELPHIGGDLDSPDGRPPARTSSATMTRPSFDAPWWAVTVEEADQDAAGRIALALVEDDRASYGCRETELDGHAGGVALSASFDAIYEAVEAVGEELAARNAPETERHSRTSLVLAEATDRTAELVRRAEEFARVRTYRGYLNHATEIAAPTEDVRVLVEQAEFWQGEFAETHNRLTETIADLTEELDQYREAEEPEEEAGERYVGEVKSCHAIPCGEPQEVTFEFQESTWEITFDLNGAYVGMRYGGLLKGGPLEPGAEPVVYRPDTVGYPSWFTVAVRSTNSTSAVELARATLVEREGLTGDVFAVMDGTSTVEESGASAAQLAWAYKWSEEQLATVEEHAATFRTHIERLTQAGATA